MPPRPDLGALVDELRERELTLASAESLTGGMFAWLVVDEPGSGEVFVGSAVTYSSEAKRRVLGVRDCPVISAECAIDMACGAAELYGADVGVGLTGVAGPARQEDQPVGTVFVAARVGAGAHGREACEEHRFDGSPNDIREASVAAAVALVRRLLADGGPGSGDGRADERDDDPAAQRDDDRAAEGDDDGAAERDVEGAAERAAERDDDRSAERGVQRAAEGDVERADRRETGGEAGSDEDRGGRGDDRDERAPGQGALTTVRRSSAMREADVANGEGPA